MERLRHQELDVVVLRVDSGRWPAGTVGTAVEVDAERVLVEISDERGHALDLITLPHEAVAAQAPGDRASAASRPSSDELGRRAREEEAFAVDRRRRA